MIYQDLCTKNRQLNEVETENGSLVLNSMPQHLMLIPTSICNLKCIMCERVNHPYTLPFAEVQKLYFLIPYLQQIDIQGGEPFLLDYFKEFLSKLVSFRHLRIGLLTNGLLLNELWVDLLVRENVFLSFSIDSTKEETYEYIRKGADFRALLNNIELINRLSRRRDIRSPLHTVNTVVMKSNYRQLPLLPRFCKAQGFSRLTFDYLRPEVALEEDIFITRPDTTAIDFLRKILPEINAECQGLGLEFDYQAILPFLSQGCQEEKKDKPEITQKKICSLPWKKIFVDSDGSIRPDCLCTKVVGNLKEFYTINEAWNNKMMQQYRRNIIKNEIKNWCSDACLMKVAASQYI